jgi:SecD/SecF fusion protein
MQNKGAIRLFAIILGLVCLYQMSFTFITRGVESDARDFAAGDTAKERQYLDSIKNVGVYNLGVYNFTYNECKARELVLGLDLQGGMNVTLEISTVDVVKTLANNSTDPDFAKAIALAQANETTSDKDFVTLFGEAWETVAPGKDLASPALFGNSQNKAIVPFKTSNADVVKFLKEQADVAIENSFLVLRTRIDKFGVTSPNIQKLGTSGRILVELPGVKDKARVRKLLQGSANLEFWETYDNVESYQYLTRAEDVLRALAGGNIANPAD